MSDTTASGALPDPRAMTVALVGIGRMGSAMARALAREGVPLVLHNRTRAAADTLASELGARVADTPGAAASEADVVLTMLADDAAVTAVYDGADGILAGVRPGSVLVDCSTITPDTVTRLAARSAESGASLLDAPVSGSTATAESGQLTLMVGGDEAALERVRPALEPLAKSIVHVGPSGSGAAMKLAVNTVIFGLNGAVAEGLVLAEAAGIDRALAYDVIASSAVGAPFVQYKRAAFTDPEGTPVAFALDLAAKDLRLITGLAGELGVPVPQAAANLALITDASAGGRGGLDFSTVASELRSRASLHRAGSPSMEEEDQG